ncbi:MAG: c-type cytochrome [Chloroflexi bacterium]|nr:c-type cytochrome [Chloroflexota bacterium]
MSNRPPESQIPPFFPALVFLGFFVLLIVLLRPASAPQSTVSPGTATVIALEPTTQLPTATAQVAQSVAYSPALVAEGQEVLQSICSACHGPDARGIPGLGKNLIESQFVHGLSDEELLQFVIKGRDTSDPLNTTGVAMPPRGGNPSLTDDQLRAVIAYIRTQSSSASAVQAVPNVVAAMPTAAPLIATVLPTRIPVTPPLFSAQTAYSWSCAGCHGADGKGSGSFGPGFADSTLLADRTALLAFLTEGRPLADPRSEFPHPAQGGYPALTSEQLSTLTDYVLTLASSHS